MVINRVNRIRRTPPVHGEYDLDMPHVMAAMPLPGDRERDNSASTLSDASTITTLSDSGGHAYHHHHHQRHSMHPYYVQNRNTQCPKKQRYIWGFEIYATICLFYLIGTASLWGHTFFNNMKYFIREPDTTPFFEVETGSTWRISKFIIGSSIHMALSIFTVVLLVGMKSLQESMQKYKDKMFLWSTVLAIMAEYLIINSSVDYILSRPSIENGYLNNTIFPPAPNFKEKLENCTKESFIVQSSRSTLHLGQNQSLVRVNLKWFTEILCKPRNKDVPHPFWEEMLHESVDEVGEHTQICERRQASLKANGAEDCHKAFLLQYACYAWSGLAILGGLFCLTLANMYGGKVKLMTVPMVRLSFTDLEESTGEDQRKVGQRSESGNKVNNNPQLQPPTITVASVA